MCITPLYLAAKLHCACCLYYIKSLVLHTKETLITQIINWNNVIISPPLSISNIFVIPTHPTYFWGHVTGTRHFYLALLNCLITKLVLYFMQQNTESKSVYKERIKKEKQYLKHQQLTINLSLSETDKCAKLDLWSALSFHKLKKKPTRLRLEPLTILTVALQDNTSYKISYSVENTKNT